MSIPLWIFLYIWIAVTGLVSIGALLSALMLTKFGLAGTRTVIMFILFISVPVAIIGATAQYASTVDWNQSIVLFETRTEL